MGLLFQGMDIAIVYFPFVLPGSSIGTIIFCVNGFPNGAVGKKHRKRIPVMEYAAKGVKPFFHMEKPMRLLT